MKNILNNTWFITIFGGVIIASIMALIFFGIKNYNIVPLIRNMNNEINEINLAISDLKNNYLAKDVDGIEVKVSINKKLKDNAATVFKNNDLKLKRGDCFTLTNRTDIYLPKIELMVTQEVEPDLKLPKSEAVIFISTDAASKLVNLSYEFKQGVYLFNFKKFFKQTREGPSEMETNSKETKENVN